MSTPVRSAARSAPSRDAWSATIDWDVVCTTDADAVLTHLTTEQLDLIGEHGLALPTGVTSSGVWRDLIRDLLLRTRPDPRATLLCDAIGTALCPAYCSTCPDVDQDTVCARFDAALGKFDAENGPVTWVVTDWHEDSYVAVDRPPIRLVVGDYTWRRHFYRRLQVRVHPSVDDPAVVATIALDDAVITVRAFTDPVDQKLVIAGSEPDVDLDREVICLEPLLSASPQMRAVMAGLYDNPDLRLPSRLRVTYGTSTSEVAVGWSDLRRCGLEVLATLAAPLVDVRPEFRDLVLGFLETSGPDWAATVAAARAALA